ncbi:unnamed protein product [Ixodes persulcatus]
MLVLLRGPLVEQAKAHVVSGLLGLFLLLLLLGCFWNATNLQLPPNCKDTQRSPLPLRMSAASASNTLTLGDDVFDRLPLEFADHLFDALGIAFDADTAEYLFDVGSRWVLVSAHRGQEISGDVTHLKEL